MIHVIILRSTLTVHSLPILMKNSCGLSWSLSHLPHFEAVVTENQPLEKSNVTSFFVQMTKRD